MARSFGDLVAASVGVSPEPEVLNFDLKTQDKFIIIASDGVWEFLSNDMVILLIIYFLISFFNNKVMRLVIPYFNKNLP